MALEGSDPHAVGVAIKPLSAAGSSQDGSVDAAAFEQLMQRGKGKQRQAAAQQEQQRGSGGFKQT